MLVGESIMSKTIPFLLHIGFDKFIPSDAIIGIFSALNFKEFAEKPMVTQEIVIEQNLPVKSYVYCVGGYLVGSPIEAKTLKGRYEKFQNKVNGLSDNKNL